MSCQTKIELVVLDLYFEEIFVFAYILRSELKLTPFVHFMYSPCTMCYMKNNWKEKIKIFPFISIFMLNNVKQKNTYKSFSDLKKSL